MKSEDRRESILAAASRVFGERGYVGTTTDAVAQAAGVSQPYVVRMFGTKEALFLAVLERSLDRLLATFRTAVEAARAADGAAKPALELHERIGSAYIELLADRGLLLSLMHAFVLGADPTIGRAAREGFVRVYHYLRAEAGFSPEQTREFLANGMLVNTLVGIRMMDDYESDPDVREMLDTAFPAKAAMLRELLAREAAPPNPGSPANPGSGER